MLIKRGAAVLAAACLAALLVCCGKGDKSNNAGEAGTSERLLSEYADTDLEEDSEQEEDEAEEPTASADLFFEEGSVCTQFFRLVPPEEWAGGVSYHYFQEPETGRYALDIIENSSMAATDGVGGFVYSIVLYDTYTEERGMENSGYAGMLRGSDGGFYYVFLEFPTGKQYTEGTEEAYRRAADTKSWIAGNIEGRNGYTFEAGKEPENEEGEEKQ